LNFLKTRVIPRFQTLSFSTAFAIVLMGFFLKSNVLFHWTNEFFSNAFLSNHWAFSRNQMLFTIRLMSFSQMFLPSDWWVFSWMLLSLDWYAFSRNKILFTIELMSFSQMLFPAPSAIYRPPSFPTSLHQQQLYKNTFMPKLVYMYFFIMKYKIRY